MKRKCFYFNICGNSDRMQLLHILGYVASTISCICCIFIKKKKGKSHLRTVLSRFQGWSSELVYPLGTSRKKPIIWRSLGESLDDVIVRGIQSQTQTRFSVSTSHLNWEACVMSQSREANCCRVETTLALSKMERIKKERIRPLLLLPRMVSSSQPQIDNERQNFGLKAPIDVGNKLEKKKKKKN